MMETDEEVLDRAWQAYEEGRHADALAEVERIDPDWPDRWMIEALARTETGELAAARALVDRLAQLADIEDDPDFLWALGELCLREWRTGDAHRAFHALDEIEHSVVVLEKLALCAEIEGDLEHADHLYEEALGLDPVGFIPPPRLSTEEFERVITEAIEGLPEEFRRPLESAEILVEPMPAIDQVDLADPSETPPDMLGLFVGRNELEIDETAGAQLPPRIHLFQRNIERACRDPEHLVTEIQKTLYHEIGHMLGFDEEGVAELGLE